VTRPVGRERRSLSYSITSPIRTRDVMPTAPIPDREDESGGLR